MVNRQKGENLMESFGEYTVRGQVKRFNCFDKLCENTSYLIGYLACDGSYVSCKGNRGYDFMAVASKDLYILEGFKEDFCPDMTIYYLGVKSSKKVHAVSEVWELRFPRKMNESFRKFGVLDYKISRRIIGVSISNFLPYLAGCIDSDGFISVKYRRDCRTPRLCFYITHQSSVFLKDLQHYLSQLGVNTYVHPHGTGAYRLNAQNTSQNITLLEKVYPFIRNKKRKTILYNYLSSSFFVPQASGELLEPTGISSQATSTLVEGSETTGEVQSS